MGRAFTKDEARVAGVHAAGRAEMRVQGCDEIGLALAMPTAAVAIRTSLEEAAKGDVVCSKLQSPLHLRAAP